MSLSLLGHKVHLGFGWVRGHKIYFLWFPMYSTYHNCDVCVICASDVPMTFET